MQTKGIVRKIDELGRIVLPVELRKTLRIAEGDSLEITCADDGIMLKKKGLLVDCEAFCRAAASGLAEAYEKPVFVFDTHKIVASAGLGRDVVGQDVGEELAACVRARRAKRVKTELAEDAVAIFPLSRNGELFGGVGIVGLGEESLAAGAACCAFLSRYV